MKIGINGMGRIGRLALRAAMGAVLRPEDDPRAGNRLDVVHVNEIKGGALEITTTDLQDLLRREPESWEAFATRHRSEFC